MNDIEALHETLRRLIPGWHDAVQARTDCGGCARLRDDLSRQIDRAQEAEQQRDGYRRGYEVAQEHYARENQRANIAERERDRAEAERERDSQLADAARDELAELRDRAAAAVRGRDRLAKVADARRDRIVELEWQLRDAVVLPEDWQERVRGAIRGMSVVQDHMTVCLLLDSWRTAPTATPTGFGQPYRVPDGGQVTWTAEVADGECFCLGQHWGHRDDHRHTVDMRLIFDAEHEPPSGVDVVRDGEGDVWRHDGAEWTLNVGPPKRSTVPWENVASYGPAVEVRPGDDRPGDTGGGA